MQDAKSLAHSVWDCKYHIVRIPKYRRKKLYGELRKYLGEVFHELARQRESRMEAAGIGVTVINTLKFKAVNESVKKTDKHDASTIAEFPEKDMLPESKLCGRESEQMRRLLKARMTPVRAEVVMKNQTRALLTAEGLEDRKASLQSKRVRPQIAGHRTRSPTADGKHRPAGGERQEDRGGIAGTAAGDRTVELLWPYPGAARYARRWTIRAYLDGIRRFGSAKKFCAFAGLTPRARNSNGTVRHGSITKRGPKELRTAPVQAVTGMRQLKGQTLLWRLMRRHEALKARKGSGKSIIATARKAAVIIWNIRCMR